VRQHLLLSNIIPLTVFGRCSFSAKRRKSLCGGLKNEKGCFSTLTHTSERKKKKLGVWVPLFFLLFLAQISKTEKLGCLFNRYGVWCRPWCHRKKVSMTRGVGLTISESWALESLFCQSWLVWKQTVSKNLSVIIEAKTTLHTNCAHGAAAAGSRTSSSRTRSQSRISSGRISSGSSCIISKSSSSSSNNSM
jgi:hypothetical protein